MKEMSSECDRSTALYESVRAGASPVEDTIDDLLICTSCHGNGVMSFCGWCETGVKHSHCDDTWELLCGCRLYEHAYRFFNGGLWLRKINDLWTVCRDFVEFDTTEAGFKALQREDAVKNL